jgi:hypothetical protein
MLLSYDDKVHRFDLSSEIFQQIPGTDDNKNINVSSIKV